ncbi:transposase [Desulfofundulus thermobenzoicus]|uniref:Transposase n=1 Tax=Desulfofundulus thermobenzoicus TaxID=29376 RepID=A0A6N7IQK6_9FIRM|nr:Rpn family recombination-promoting nuclease/putative transposase [Desulfofundulus thermobenzoicus]MQL52312.1 transposase [Desulfofundulus thermobenzoicus]HHW44627.1 transposase [Desulfotomaculum sp.]
MNENQIDHDRLFKELLETFFAEFMELFFPEASRAIDLTQLKFLQQEVFTDVTAGEKRKVDILVETRLKGEPGLILVHVEPQSYVQGNFNERMFVYFSRLYEKYRRKILPVAVFSYDRVRDEPDSFELVFPFLDVLNFRFYKLELKKLNWREYIQGDNPVAAALLSKMGFQPEEKVKVKVEFMRMLARMKLDPARMELLAGFFETYLKLNREEEEQYNRELGRLDSKEVDVIMQITTSWHEKGRAEGRAEGRVEGKVEAKREVICKYLVRKFGDKSSDMQQKVQQITNLEVLDYILEELFAANTLEEARAIVNNGAGKPS